MYAHCIFCRSHLGANTSIERFPAGSKLAFDERQGRLWVICPRCARWNLSPLEERWEVIEDCERLFARASRRVSTDNIGLSVLPAGLQLVRIGAPKRPEMAAWRYGDELMRRRRRHRGGQLITFGAVVLGWGPVLMGRFAYRAWLKRRPITTALRHDGTTRVLRGIDAGSMRFLPGSEQLTLHLGSTTWPHTTVVGQEAFRVAGLLLPWVNAPGTDRAGVERAVRQIERYGTGIDLFHAAVPKLNERLGALRDGAGLVRRAAPELKLALEMAAHEDLEQQSLRGELTLLEGAWREAEELAGIADGLLVPAGVQRLLERIRALETTPDGSREETHG